MCFRATIVVFLAFIVGLTRFTSDDAPSMFGSFVIMTEDSISSPTFLILTQPCDYIEN